VGDFAYLPLVMDRPPSFASQGHAKGICILFITVLTLNTSIKKLDQNVEHQCIKDLLTHIKNVVPTIDDWKLFISPNEFSLYQSKLELFDKSS